MIIFNPLSYIIFRIFMLEFTLPWSALKRKKIIWIASKLKWLRHILSKRSITFDIEFSRPHIAMILRKRAINTHSAKLWFLTSIMFVELPKKSLQKVYYEFWISGLSFAGPRSNWSLICIRKCWNWKIPTFFKKS